MIKSHESSMTVEMMILDRQSERIVDGARISPIHVPCIPHSSEISQCIPDSVTPHTLLMQRLSQSNRPNAPSPMQCPNSSLCPIPLLAPKMQNPILILSPTQRFTFPPSNIHLSSCRLATFLLKLLLIALFISSSTAALSHAGFGFPYMSMIAFSCSVQLSAPCQPAH